MEIIETVEFPARKEDLVVRLKCDLCGKESNHPDNWEIYEPYDFDEVVVQRKHGCRFPEGGNTETTEFHICPPCFTDKLAPFLQGLGAVATEKDVSW